MHALGLTVSGDDLGFGLWPGDARGGRQIVISHSSADEIDKLWTGATGERIHEQRHPDGHVLLAVDRSNDLGFRVAARGFGTQALSADGRRIALAAPARAPAWRPALLLFGRTLPIAGAVQGLEALHASAVVLDGQVVALVAASGTGKSSLATHLVAQGAQFFTDDVLAVEHAAGEVVAHPGPRISKVAFHEYRAAPLASRAGLGRPLGAEGGELLLEPAGVAGSAPLRALYVLRRHGVDPSTVRPIAADPRLLLAMSYVSDVDTPERRETQLDVCGSLAEQVPLYDLRLPARGSALEAAAHVALHFRDTHT